MQELRILLRVRRWFAAKVMTVRRATNFAFRPVVTDEKTAPASATVGKPAVQASRKNMR